MRLERWDLMFLLALGAYIATAFFLASRMSLPGDLAVVAGAAVAAVAYLTAIYKLHALYAAALRKKAKKIGEVDGVPVYRLEGRRLNAFVLPGARAVFIVGEPDVHVLRHELRHLEQGRIFYYAMSYFNVMLTTAVATFLMCKWGMPYLCYWQITPASWVTVAAGLASGICLWYKKLEMERDADIYGFGSAENFKKVAQKMGIDTNKPASRLKRLRGWLSTHPPPWVRVSEEYYDGRKSLLRLFLKDVYSRI